MKRSKNDKVIRPILRNFKRPVRFLFKLAGWIIAIAFALSVLLGLVLWGFALGDSLWVIARNVGAVVIGIGLIAVLLELGAWAFTDE